MATIRVPRIPAPPPLVRRQLRRKTRRTQRTPAVWPIVVLRCAGVLVSFVLLAGIAYEVGISHAKPHGFGPAVAATLAKPPVALGVGFVLVLALAACLRRLLFERLVRRPGPILVGDLGVPSGVAGVDAARLSASFRQRLQQLRLQAAAPLPGAMPEEGFLQMLDGNRLEANNLAGSLVRLLRVAVPSHAYEVSATLVKGPPDQPEGCCGVSAQLKRLPDGAIPVQTAWAFSWEDAIVQAADIVSAAVLPLTRLSSAPPWSGWHRYVMPARLVYHFEQAEAYAAERRYDEALDQHYRALALDPKSVDLRLEVGFVREKLGLYLDALESYLAAVKIAEESSKSLYRGRALRHRKGTGRTARYRLAVLLAGDSVAHQWRDAADETDRDKHRIRVGEAVEPELMAWLRRYKLVGAGGGDELCAKPPWDVAAAAELLHSKRDGEKNNRDLEYLELRNVFSHLADRILRQVRREVRRQWGPRTWLTPLGVSLTIEWVALRRTWVTDKHRQVKDGSAAPWRPPKPKKRKPWKFRTGTEHYNAACLYALPLMVDKLQDDEATRKVNVKQALHHLAAGVSSTTSWYVVSRRDWLLSEDPDLDGLRPLPEFKQFENMYFPSDTRLPLRPPNAHEWEFCHYAAQLVTETARRWERTWEERRQQLERQLDARTVMRWLADEAEAWKLLDDLARQHLDWPVRRDLIVRMQRWSGDYGFEPLRVPVPRFAWDDPCDPCDPSAKLVKAAVQTDRERLKVLSEATARLSTQRPPDYARLEAELRDRDAWGAHRIPAGLDELCELRAQLWRTLAEWIGDVHAPGGGMPAKAFGDAVVRAGDAVVQAEKPADAAALAP